MYSELCTRVMNANIRINVIKERPSYLNMPMLLEDAHAVPERVIPITLSSFKRNTKRDVNTSMHSQLKRSVRYSTAHDLKWTPHTHHLKAAAVHIADSLIQ